MDVDVEDDMDGGRKREEAESGVWRTKLRMTADWTSGDQAKEVRMGDVEREGQRERRSLLPNKLPDHGC